MSRKKATAAELDPAVTAPLSEIILRLGVKRWDVAIISDGSGTTWNSACGWAAVIADRQGQQRKLLQGAMNFGTSYLAELLPYVHALSWYIEGPGRALLTEKLKSSQDNKVIIHAITDNQTIARQGQGLIGRKIGVYYWSMFDAMEDLGYEVHWHWLERETIALNHLCDHLAGLCRKSIHAVESVAPPAGVTAYSCNTEPEATSLRAEI